jgi:hypothetical protein
MTNMTFAVQEDLADVGNNPEMAEMDNPRGLLVGSAHFVVATEADGRRYAHDAVSYTINGYAVNGNPPRDADDEDMTTFTKDSNGMTVERLERLAAYLNSHQPGLNSTHWTEIQACYGSVAYQRDGWEQVAIDIERDEARFEGYRV